MTVLMPSWYYEKKDLRMSPSVLDSLEPEVECRYRREGARFIIDVGTKMGLRYDTMATGVVYFHRFYMFHSFKQFPRHLTACCCLFLAGKVEETPKKCKDVIRIAKSILEEKHFQQFGDDPKEEVMTLERILLQTIRFDLQVSHPYGFLLKYAKSLKGDQLKLQNMVQMAWTFINDSLCTTLCLQFEPEVIAIALMYLAGKLSKFEVVDWIERTPKHSHWWDMFVEGMSIELLEDICHQVLDLYSIPTSNRPQDSPPATPPSISTRKAMPAESRSSRSSKQAMLNYSKKVFEQVQAKYPDMQIDSIRKVISRMWSELPDEAKQEFMDEMSKPSPVEPAISPVKPKEIPVVGQPIPRLEPGELKRKVTPPEPTAEPPESKAPRAVTEGKAIPTITHVSPESNSIPTVRPSSPPAPIPILDSSVKAAKHNEATVKRSVSSEAIFQTASGAPPFIIATLPEPIPLKHMSPLLPVATSALPPSAAYTQSASSFYGHDAPFPNVQQPPPIFPQQFQCPPPPAIPPPPGMPHPIGGSHQFSTPPPPFNAQYPPPPPRQSPVRSQAPPPPPGILPSPSASLLPRPSMMQRTSQMHSEVLYGPRSGADMYDVSDMYNDPRSDRMRQDYDDYHGFRDNDYEGSYLDPTYQDYNHQSYPPRPPGQFRPGFGPPPRRYPMDPQHRNQGPRLPMPANVAQRPGTPTGIAPVRITGSMG